MKTTEENNRIIAEFMSGQKVTTHHNQYHVSWNELMPVVEKIEDLGYDTELVYRLDDGGHCFYINDSPIFSSQMGDKKEATYQAVVQFIEWYNEQQKP